MRRRSLTFAILAALFLAAPALAQDLPPAKQGRASPPNFYGLTPQYLLCMGTKHDGRPAEIARTPWEGGAVPADACPPETDIFQAYTIKAISGIGRTTGSSHAATGGHD
jgi:hypothetical protein